MTALDGWENFYVIVGSSAGALIGLQFVVLALIAETPDARANAQAGAAFSTPSVVHFGVVLLLSAIISAPWHTIGVVGVVWGLVGVAGIVYAIIVARRMRLQTAYRPVFEDWLFHALIPLPRMELWPSRHTWLSPMHAQACSSLRPQRCCSSLLAFITRGMLSHITFLSAGVDNARAEHHR